MPGLRCRSGGCGRMALRGPCAAVVPARCASRRVPATCWSRLRSLRCRGRHNASAIRAPGRLRTGLRSGRCRGRHNGSSMATVAAVACVRSAPEAGARTPTLSRVESRGCRLLGALPRPGRSGRVNAGSRGARGRPCRRVAAGPRTPRQPAARERQSGRPAGHGSPPALPKARRHRACANGRDAP